ncbi:hypothetical protein D3C86_1138300 [compost metagenome]
MTTYRVDRANGRGVLFFQMEPPVPFDPQAPSPRNEVWKRALAAGHVDAEDCKRGCCQPDAKPRGSIFLLPA